MSEFNVKTPWWFWVIAAIFLLWSLIGCAGYLAERLMSDAAYTDSFGAEMLQLREITPWWATSGYAIGVWGGLVGGVFLLLRKRLCLPFFFASFIGAVIGFIPMMTDGRFKAVMGAWDYGFMIFIWAICIFIIWFALKMLNQPSSNLDVFS